MNLFRDLGIGAQALRFAFRGFGRDHTLEPLVFFGIVQALLLGALARFYLPTLAPALEPLIRWIGGDAATHYPDHLWTLPETFRSANLALLLTLGVLAQAVATARFAHADRSWKTAFAMSPSLVVVAIAGPGLAWGVTTAMNQIPTEISLASFIIRMGLQGIELALIVIILSLTAYAVPAVILDERGPFPALAESVRTWLRFPIPTLLLFALPAALLFPPTFFLVEMNVVESGLTPEAVAIAWAVVVALQWIAWALLTGAVTGIWLESRGRRR